MTKKIAVLVMNYNSKKYLPDLFESLKTTDYPEDKWKLVFLDNNSGDDSLEYAKKHYPQAHFIAEKTNWGFAEGNNIAYRWARDNNYDYIVLLNQDTIVTPRWLRALVETMEEDPTIGALQPKILLHPKTEYINNVGNRLHFLGFGYGDQSGIADKKYQKDLNKINYCSGACVMMPIKLINKIGLFDSEMFMYLEDLDLGWRISLAGYKNAINPNVVIYHKYQFSRSSKMIGHFEKNRYICLYKNYKLATIILLLPMLILMDLGILLFSIKNKWFSKKLWSYAYFLKPSTWKYMRRAKKESMKIRKLKDKDIFKTFTSVIIFQELKNPLLYYVANPIMTIYYYILRLIIRW